MDYDAWHNAHFRVKPILLASFVVALLLTLGLWTNSARAGSAGGDRAGWCMYHIEGVQAFVQERDVEGRPAWTARTALDNFHQWLEASGDQANKRYTKSTIQWLEEMVVDAFSGQELNEAWRMKHLRACIAATGQVSGREEFRSVCEARVIAQYSTTMTRAQWLEIVEAAEGVGKIDAEHAARLRHLIDELYASLNPGAWAEAKCEERRI